MITAWDTPALDEASAWAVGGSHLTVSPDGRTLWSARWEHVVGWDVASGRVVATIDESRVRHLAVTADAVVTGGQGWWSRWTEEQGAWRRVAHEPCAHRDVIALGQAPGAVLLRDFQQRMFWGASGRELRTEFDFDRAAFRADGAMAAAVGYSEAGDGPLLVFDQDGEERYRVGLGSGLAVVRWVGDDVLVGGAMGVLRYSPQQGQTLWSNPSSNVVALAVSRDERTAVAIEERKGGAVAFVFLRADDGATLGEWTLERGVLAWARGVVVRVVDTGARLSVSLPLRVVLPTMALAPDGTWCAVTCQQGVLILGAAGDLLKVPGHGSGDVRAAEWTPDGRVVVAYDNTPAVRVLRPGAHEAEVVFEHDGAGTRALFPSPDGRLVAVHAYETGDHGFRLHDLRDGSRVEVRAEAMGRVAWVLWTGAGDALWVACWQAQKWEVNSSPALWRVDAATGAARHVWTRDRLPAWEGLHWSLHRVGESLYAALPRACLTLDPATGAVRRERPWAAPPFAFLDDRRVLTRDGACADLADGALRYGPTSESAEERESMRAVSPSRAWALSCPRHTGLTPQRSPPGGVLRARATETGGLLGEFEVANEESARLSRDGRGLAAIHERRLRLYRVDAEALEAAARRATGR